MTSFPLSVNFFSLDVSDILRSPRCPADSLGENPDPQIPGCHFPIAEGTENVRAKRAELFRVQPQPLALHVGTFRARKKERVPSLGTTWCAPTLPHTGIYLHTLGCGSDFPTSFAVGTGSPTRTLVRLGLQSESFFWLYANLASSWVALAVEGWVI